MMKHELAEALREIIREALHAGIDGEAIRKMVDESLGDAGHEDQDDGEHEQEPPGDEEIDRPRAHGGATNRRAKSSRRG